VGLLAIPISAFAQSEKLNDVECLVLKEVLDNNSLVLKEVLDSKKSPEVAAELAEVREVFDANDCGKLFKNSDEVLKKLLHKKATLKFLRDGLKVGRPLVDPNQSSYPEGTFGAQPIPNPVHK
jgi:hypothetical protein